MKFFTSGIIILFLMLNFLSGQQTGPKNDHKSPLIEQNTPLAENYFNSQKSSFDRTIRYNQANYNK